MKSKKLVLCGLFCAIGVLLPQLFHVLGPSAGMMFLPMHIPVLMAGLLLGPWAGGVTGLVSPALSCLMTGMPVPAKLPFMALELITYGLISGLFAGKKTTGQSYLGLASAQIAGRVVNALSAAAAVYLLGAKSASLPAVWAAVVTGLPGIIIQWIVIVPLVLALKKFVAESHV